MKKWTLLLLLSSPASADLIEYHWSLTVFDDDFQRTSESADLYIVGDTEQWTLVNARLIANDVQYESTNTPLLGRDQWKYRDDYYAWVPTIYVSFNFSAVNAELPDATFGWIALEIQTGITANPIEHLHQDLSWIGDLYAPELLGGFVAMNPVSKRYLNSAPVPEPSTLALFSIGLAGPTLRRRLS